MARKTYTSTEVKQRWIKANYKRYNINLRFDTDNKLIDYVEKRRQHANTSEIFREAVEALIEKEQNK